jgi:hypothetical protein
MVARHDCRHYSRRTTAAGDALERCKLGMASEFPFDCPDDCLFFEARRISSAGWQRDPTDPPSDPAPGG